MGVCSMLIAPQWSLLREMCRAVSSSPQLLIQSSNMTRQQNKSRCERLDVILVARHEDTVQMLYRVYPQ